VATRSRPSKTSSSSPSAAWSRRPGPGEPVKRSFALSRSGHSWLDPGQIVGATGFESAETSAPSVADRRVNDADPATKDDATRREVSALSTAGDAIEAALAHALGCAAEAERFDVVAQLARELEARRLARSENVIALNPARRGRGGAT